jgi:hypothetical protein
MDSFNQHKQRIMSSMSDTNSSNNDDWIGVCVCIGVAALVIYFFRIIALSAMWILCVGGGIGSIVLATVSYYRFQRTTGDDVADKDHAMRTVYLSAGSAVLSVIMWFLIPLMYAGGTVDNTGNGSSISGNDTEPSGLTLEQLGLASQTVQGYWKEEDPLFDDEAGWSGTSGVISANATTLTLITNSHVLNVISLACADDSTPSLDSPEIVDYQLVVTFASGVERNVLECGDQIGSKDLALLKVDASGLEIDRDYVLLPIFDTNQISTGDDVVAVGSPLGIKQAGTHTFGKISAVRNDNSHGRMFQTDAAINHGNSGGPLFRKINDRHFWIGVNTFRVDNANNLGFALDAQSVMDSDYYWFNATTQGVTNYIWSEYIDE